MDGWWSWRDKLRRGYPQINLDKFAISGYDGKKTYPDELSSRDIKVDTDKSGWSSIGEARQKDKAAKIKLRYDGSRLIMVNKIDTLITKIKSENKNIRDNQSN